MLARIGGPRMTHLDESLYEFDIDVDVAPLLGGVSDPVLIRDTWYRLAHNKPGRRPRVQRAAERMLQNTLLLAQWRARERRSLDRRRAVRVPLIARVIPLRGKPFTTTDISLSGMRASGEPTAPVLDVEFKIPGLSFPVDTKVEVVSYRPSPIVPLVGLRFVNLEKVYADEIARLVNERRERMLARAA
jgi:hypothetical protein